MVRSIVYAVAVLALPKKKYYKSATMNPKQLLVCCVLVFSSLVSLHFPAESAPTRERLSSTSDTNPLWQWRDKLRALLDSKQYKSRLCCCRRLLDVARRIFPDVRRLRICCENFTGFVSRGKRVGLLSNRRR